tara:strand:- start:139 stop:501 length:363 start_codon:yes stop_codon:yes gene_type:complete
MFMMQPHRRSNRRPRSKKTAGKDTKDFISAYTKANRVEAMPGKLWRESQEKKEDDYDELPNVDGFEYDKEMYMGNDRYASMINDELAEFIKEKIWNEAQEKYANDEAEHKKEFDESKNGD